MPREKPDVAPSVPSQLGEGRYRLLDPIGEGGMAGVYRAVDTQLDVQRAIKLLRYRFARKKKIRDRFEAEARAMARVEHAHIVRVFDVGLEARTPYIVMELVEGASLEELLAEGPLESVLALQLMGMVAEGVAHAHAEGIVHRDIKPANVLVDDRGIAKLTDFGIAQSAHDTRLTKTGSTMGTLGFMAPEQRYDAKSADHRADIFSLGATLWRLVSEAELTELYLPEEQPRLLQGVHPAIADVVLTATSYEPRDRYPNAGTFRNALLRAHRILDDESKGLVSSEVGSYMSVPPPSDSLPPYVDRASLAGEPPRPLLPAEQVVAPSLPPGPPPAPTPAEPERTEAPAPLPAPPPSLSPVVPPRYAAALALLVCLGVGVAFGLVVTAGARAVEQAAQRAHDTDVALVEVVMAEQRLLDELDAAGLGSKELRARHAEVMSAAPDERLARALAFVEAASDAVEPARGRALVPAEVRSVEGVDRLRVAVDARRRAHEDWQQTAASASGQLALTVSLAEPPDELTPP